MDPRHLIQAFGTLGIMAMVFAESGVLAGFFLPGDSLLFTAGLLASQGHLDLVALMVGCPTAAVAGDQVGYAFGRRVGPTVFRRPEARLFHRRNLDLAREYFARHGPRTVVVARFVPVVRTFVPVLAGATEMPYRTFVAANLAGGVVWGAGMVLAGWGLGRTIGGRETWLLPVLAVVVAASLVPVGRELLSLRRQSQAHRLVEAHGDEGDE